jgi:hypothetical protein
MNQPDLGRDRASFCEVDNQLPLARDNALSVTGCDLVCADEHGLLFVRLTFRFKSDLRNHQAIVQPRLYDSDCLMVTQITLVPSCHRQGLGPCSLLLLPRAAGQGAVGSAPGRGRNGRSVHSGRILIKPDTEQGRTDLADPATASAARLPITGSVSDPARLHPHGKTAGQRAHGNQERKAPRF